MLNKHMIVKDSYSNANQILADPNLQFSVGCVIPQNLGNSKAGTPIKIDLTNFAQPVKKPDGSTIQANAVLLHDVDLSHGQTNGTALLFGFVNLSRIDSTTKALIEANYTSTNMVGGVNFIKLD